MWLDKLFIIVSIIFVWGVFTHVINEQPKQAKTLA